MQFKHLIKTSVCALVLLGAVSAQAADDVYVDLSVLNNLQPGDSLFVETQPLFPVVKKSPVKKAVKKKTPKKAGKKVEPVKVVIEETEIEKSIIIAPHAPEIPQPLAEEKKEEAKPAAPITLPEVSSVAREEIAPVVNQLPSEAEHLLPQSDDNKAVEEDVLPEPVVEGVSQIQEKTQEKEVEEPVVDDALEKATPQAPVALTQDVSAVEPVASATEDKVIQPLIPAEAETAVFVPAEGQIMFDEGDYAISQSNADKILALINSFDDPHKHKIAIYAYNYDNGENSFKKKKLSLDRATEIRSLLLSKGYKNFSIKVINVTDDADKRNLVEIEEIK